MANKDNDKTYRGNASQFFVAGELCRRGHSAVVTLGNTPHTDILCSNRNGTKFVHIQVKTFVPGNKTCSVGQKAERSYGDRFFWVLSGIPEPGSLKPFEFYIIPSETMAHEVSKAHAEWKSLPGKHGQPRNDTKFRIVNIPTSAGVRGDWDISKFLNAWHLIDQCLGE